MSIGQLINASPEQRNRMIATLTKKMRLSLIRLAMLGAERKLNEVRDYTAIAELLAIVD